MTELIKIKNRLAKISKIIDERNTSYGDCFEAIAKMWSVILGSNVSTEDVKLCMLGLKVIRYRHGKDEDSVLDMIGYAVLLSGDKK